MTNIFGVPREKQKRIIIEPIGVVWEPNENGYIVDLRKNMMLLKKLATVLKQYGNNYRSIFHIEHAIFSIMEAFS